MNDIASIGALKQKLVRNETSDFAIVSEVSGAGVKIRIYGEPEPRPIYYNTLVLVAPGDKVHIKHLGEEILVMGKLLY